jgi:hypothetical protein
MLSTIVRLTLLLESPPLDEAIPELTKGSKTPYKRWNDNYKGVAPLERVREFERRIEKEQKKKGFHSLTDANAWYRIGSGYHWVGTIIFTHDEEMFENGYNEFFISMTLQRSRGGWDAAENRVIRWLLPDRRPGRKSGVSTGTGSIEFLRWVLEELKIFIDRRKTMAAHGRPSVLAISWADEKRKRAYAWLKRLGFEEGVDSDGEPAYMMRFPSPQQSAAEPEHS